MVAGLRATGMRCSIFANCFFCKFHVFILSCIPVVVKINVNTL